MLPLVSTLMIVFGTVTLVAGVQKWGLLFRLENVRRVTSLFKIFKPESFYIFSGLTFIFFGILLLVGK